MSATGGTNETEPTTAEIVNLTDYRVGLWRGKGLAPVGYPTTRDYGAIQQFFTFLRHTRLVYVNKHGRLATRDASWYMHDWLREDVATLARLATTATHYMAARKEFGRADSEAREKERKAVHPPPDAGGDTA